MQLDILLKAKKNKLFANIIFKIDYYAMVRYVSRSDSSFFSYYLVITS